jgi:hypothetical protein
MMEIHVVEEIGPGQFQFICRDCGYEIFVFGERWSEPLCATCRWLADHPDMPESVKAMLRGESQ